MEESDSKLLPPAAKRQKQQSVMSFFVRESSSTSDNPLEASIPRGCCRTAECIENLVGNRNYSNEVRHAMRYFKFPNWHDSKIGLKSGLSRLLLESLGF